MWKRTAMAKRIKCDDDMYKESLSWMSYRYAIGITEYAGRSGMSNAERYRMFRDIEFDTEEFHALAAAFADFLKRKKIKNIVDLRNRYRENDLIWLSRNYAMGRHSYAASHCEDIMTYSNEVLSPERKEFMALDIRRELADHLRWQSFFFDVPMGIEETHSPLDLFLRFITENGLDTEDKIKEYSHIQVVAAPDGSIFYRTEKKPQERAWFNAYSSIDDYLGWDELASYFLPSCHKKCRVRYEGKESIIPYIDTWVSVHNREGRIRYERAKIPIDRIPSGFHRTYLNEKYIVEDNVTE